MWKDEEKVLRASAAIQVSTLNPSSRAAAIPHLSQHICGSPEVFPLFETSVITGRFVIR